MIDDQPLADGWAALRHWPGAELRRPLDGGSVNQIRAVTLDGRTLVGRLGSRSSDDLDWESDLLTHLAACGLGVPRLVATDDGRLHADGLVLMEFVDGHPPENEADYRRVADYLHRLHEFTADWVEQRPGWHSLADLTAETRTGPLDLTALPDDVIKRCRAAWSRLSDHPRSVIHGDPNPTNIRIAGDDIVLLDWDEARVDVRLLDLSALSKPAAGLGDTERQVAEQAVHAWEACLFWNSAPDYAKRRYSRLH